MKYIYTLQCVYTYTIYILTQPMDPEKKKFELYFPTKYVIPKSLKFSHWPSKYIYIIAHS